MVNELAAHGFVEDEDCNIDEEIVQGMRALTFQKGNVSVSVCKLGGPSTFKGYWRGSKVDEEDRKIILEKLQSVMHDRAVANHKASSSTATTMSPRSTSSTTSLKSVKTSPDSTALQSTPLTASQGEREETERSTPTASSGSSGGRSSRSSSSSANSLEASGLIKFIKVHWRHSKWIADTIHLIRPLRYATHLGNSTSSADTEEEEDDFKAVVVWSNLKEKKEGVKLLERMIAQRLGGSEEDFLKGVTVCREVMDDAEEKEGKEEGETWAVLRTKDVIVGFPGEQGMEVFIERVAEWEKLRD